MVYERGEDGYLETGVVITYVLEVAVADCLLDHEVGYNQPRAGPVYHGAVAELA